MIRRIWNYCMTHDPPWWLQVIGPVLFFIVLLRYLI
jgi:hypothetical protein